ncbi:helix-turn-helix transcriptional regulator [Pseudosporangium ferrugineum]|uniref:helix-turn-helix transcriptional regulator n=1 Tax=Pseudosporangium ferrugineum TaxID=439699 RepID=UPI0011B24B0E|nr:transcriptional regulator [Pseudosporangium ferrugineum]
MAETTRELPEDWWTTEDVLAFLRTVGAPISRVTWAAYVSRGQAPAADRMFGRSPAWRPAAIRQWQAGRPRRGSVETRQDIDSSPPS